MGEVALIGLIVLYLALAAALLLGGDAVPLQPIAVLSTLLVVSVALPRLTHGRSKGWDIIGTVWPAFISPLGYLAQVRILERLRDRYIDGTLARLDERLGLYRDGAPIWNASGPFEEVWNVFYASYYAVPFVVLAVALRRGPAAAAPLTTALLVASFVCGIGWVIFPAGGYHPTGAPTSAAFGPFTAFTHGVYAQHPHFAAAFPSQHVSHAFAFAGALRATGSGAWVWLWALGVAGSTIVGQYHFSADAICGVLVGLGAAYAVQVAARFDDTLATARPAFARARHSGAR